MKILFHCQVTFRSRVRMCAYEREVERKSERMRHIDTKCLKQKNREGKQNERHVNQSIIHYHDL